MLKNAASLFSGQRRRLLPGAGRTTALVIILGVLALAAGPGLASSTSGGPAMLSLAAAQARCRESSALFDLARATVDRALLEEQQAEETAALIPGEAVVTYELALAKYLAPESARAERELAQAASEAVAVNLDLQVARAYAGTLAAERMAALAQAAAGRADDQVELANDLFRSGMAAWKDVLDAEAARAKAMAGVVSADKGLQLARLGLARLTGQSVAGLGTLDQSSMATGQVTMTVDEAVAIAARDRYEAVAAGSQVDLAQRNLELAQLYPSSAGPTGLPDPTRNQVYTIPLAEAGLQAAFAAQRLQLEQLEYEVRSAYLEVEAARKLTILLEPAVTAAREGLRLAQLRYSTGLGTNLEVLMAELNLAAAEADYQNAYFGEITAAAAFTHSHGCGSAEVYPGAASGE